MRRTASTVVEQHDRTVGPGLGVLLSLGLLAIALVSLPSCSKSDSDRPSAASPDRDDSAGAAPPTAERGGTAGNDDAAGPAAARSPRPRELTLVATGDVLLHEPLWRQAASDAAAAGADGYDFRPLLANTEPLVSEADVAICHMETPIAPPDGPFSGYPMFSVPPEIAPALADTGYDACSTASNHVLDDGADGIDRTLGTLDAAGIDHAGAARTPAEAEEPTIIDAEGVKVALLSYSYSFNGVEAPNGETWRANLIDEDAIEDEAAAARDAGAEVVVVAMHWGDEYVHEPNAQQESLAPRLIGSENIDLVLGHHVHVVQPIEKFDDGWVVYGMGNHVSNQAALSPEKAEGLLVRFTFAEDPETASWDVSEADYAPLVLPSDTPRRLLVVADALARQEPNGPSPQRLQEAWDRTTQIVLSREADEDGLTAIEP